MVRRVGGGRSFLSPISGYELHVKVPRTMLFDKMGKHYKCPPYESQQWRATKALSPLCWHTVDTHSLAAWLDIGNLIIRKLLTSMINRFSINPIPIN